MSGPHWTIDNDGQTVTVKFPSNPPVAIRLDTAELEKMIAMLGEMRAHMQPPVPDHFALGQKVVAQLDPNWMSEADLMHGFSLIHFRDPRFGWQHYALPTDGAEKLAGYLTAQVKAKRDSAIPSKKN